MLDLLVRLVLGYCGIAACSAAGIADSVSHAIELVSSGPCSFSAVHRAAIPPRVLALYRSLIAIDTPSCSLIAP